MRFLRTFNPSPFCRATLLACALLAPAGCGSKSGAPNALSPPKATATAANTESATEVPGSKPAPELLAAKSTFDASPGAGRDPFFPSSTRREVALSVAGKTGAPQPAAVSGGLKLAGIWSSKARPVALINKTAFRPGEVGEVAVEIPGAGGKVMVQKLTVRCLEIRPDSVLISVAGEPGTKELRMANGL